MAMSNIIACFSMAGVYPIYRNAVLSQIQHASVDTSMHTPHSPSVTPPFVHFCIAKDRIVRPRSKQRTSDAPNVTTTTMDYVTDSFNSRIITQSG